MTAADLTPDEFAAAVSRRHDRLRRPDPARDLPLRPRRHADGVTAAEVAEQFDLHPNVARHHLEKLAGGGYLDVELARRARRRPAGRRSATAPARSTPPSRSRLGTTTCSATLLARALERLLGPTRPHALAEEVGFEYGRALAARMEPDRRPPLGARPRSRRSPTRSPRTASPRTPSRTATSLTLVSEHCPFGEAAQQYPHVVCAVDTGMIRACSKGSTARRSRSSRRAGPTATSTASRASDALDAARVPRSRVVLAAAPGRARGDAPVPARAPRRSRAVCTPKGA